MLKNSANTSVAYSEQDRGPHRADLSPQGSPHLGGSQLVSPKSVVRWSQSPGTEGGPAEGLQARVQVCTAGLSQAGSTGPEPSLVGPCDPRQAGN